MSAYHGHYHGHYSGHYEILPHNEDAVSTVYEGEVKRWEGGRLDVSEVVAQLAQARSFRNALQAVGQSSRVSPL
jgi:hypothetical protein